MAHDITTQTRSLREHDIRLESMISTILSGIFARNIYHELMKLDGLEIHHWPIWCVPDLHLLIGCILCT